MSSHESHDHTPTSKLKPVSDLWSRLWTGIGMALVLGTWVIQPHKKLFAVGLMLVFGVSVWEWKRMSPNRRWFFWGTVILSYGFVAWLSVHMLDQKFAMMCVAVAVVSDTLAFTGGRLFKGPLLLPSISPAKTWSGALTSLLLTPLIIKAGWAFLSGAYPQIFRPMCPNESFVILAVLAFLVVCAQLGDLVESWVKRRCGVKDSGSWLPGHGGILDRIDSWLMIFMVIVTVIGVLFFGAQLFYYVFGCTFGGTEE